MQSRGVNLGSTRRIRGRRRGRGRRHKAEVLVPKLGCITPYKVLYNLVN